MTVPTKPPPLPSSLKEEAPTTKMLYLWLEPQGKVSYSVREVAELLEVAPHSVQIALTRLRELGLLKDVKAARSNEAGRYLTKRPKSRTSDREA